MRKLMTIVAALTLLSISVIASSPANSSEANPVPIVSGINSTISNNSDANVYYSNFTEKYTQEQLDEAEAALKNVMNTLYLNEKSPVFTALRDGTAPKEFMDIAFSEFKPNIRSIIPLYEADMYGWLETGEMKIEPRLTTGGLQMYTFLTLDNVTGQFIGCAGIDTDGTKWKNGSWGRIASPYETNDFYSHRVKIYELLKSTNLSVEKTTAKGLTFNGVGSGYYLTDGTHAWFLLMSPTEDSPMLTEDSVVTSDADDNMQIISMEDLKPLAEKQAVLIEKYRKYIDPNDPPMGGGIIAYGRQIEAEQQQAFLKIFIPSAIAAVVILGGGALLIVKRRKAKTSKQ